MYEITWILFDIYFTLALFCPMILHIKEKIFENFYDEVGFDTMLRMCENTSNMSILQEKNKRGCTNC